MSSKAEITGDRIQSEPDQDMSKYISESNLYNLANKPRWRCYSWPLDRANVIVSNLTRSDQMQFR